MKNKVYGVLGIKSIMANWNADFSGHPKSISTGEVFGSDKALKYPMKKMWENQNEKVLYVKSYKIDVDKKKNESTLRPKSLKERYEELFEVENLKNEKQQDVILRNLFNAIDVKNFGATFAEEGSNISITGAVQIGQGFNKYEDTTTEEQQILSPFRSDNKEQKGKGEEAKSSTLGSKIVSSEAHYVYPFAITPFVYNEYVGLGVTEGYTEEDYEKFKAASLVAATSFNTNSKLGCENELAVFIKVEKSTYLPDLAQFVTFVKGYEGEKNTLNLEFSELLNEIQEKIVNIEVYFNPYTTNLEGKIEGAKYYNIFTLKEV
ncbi:type I CRISPR-associated protein Cas7 [Psychrobacillus sp. NPDC093180]|uniref:type I CRISPR-associated protein Cas7 n=1 Tax=Psychrobacillus sp. NPDC093180 TaxID=3364489 RepID=UPI003801BF09